MNNFSVIDKQLITLSRSDSRLTHKGTKVTIVAVSYLESNIFGHGENEISGNLTAKGFKDKVEERSFTVFDNSDSGLSN